MYDAIGKIMTDGLSLGIIVLDGNYRIMLWNRWLEKHSNIRQNKILGQNIFEKFPEIRERNKDRYITECVLNKKSFLLSPMIHQYFIHLNIVKNEKSIFMLQDVRIYPMPSDGAIIIIRDLTEQILYEQEICRLNQILIGIRNINQLIVNVESEEELISKSCQILKNDVGYDLVRISYAEETGCELDVKCMNGICLPLQIGQQVIGVLHVYSEKKEFFIYEELALLEEAAADISFAISSLRDKNKRHEAEKALLEHQSKLMSVQKMEAIGVLAAGIAHDFNNILQSLLGYTEMSMDDAPAGSLLNSNLKEILNAGLRAKELVKQILMFARKSEQQLEPVYISSIIKEALKFVRASLPSTIEIRRNIDKSAKPVLGDSTQIYQLILNLITNAYHAMEEKSGILEINLSDTQITEQHKIPLKPGSYLKLTISDTGIGMDEHICQRIFDPYFTTKEKGKGTGLGLSIVYGIVVNHAGHIDVTSEHGKGTTFTVYFPIISEPVIETAFEKKSSLTLTGHESILVIDDEQQIVGMYWRHLKKLGYRVTAITSSIEALKVFRNQSENFDLIITDLTMPQMTGDRLAEEFLRIRPDIPVILCTGYQDMISEEKIKRIGIRKLMIKPVNIKAITEVIREILESGGSA